MHNNKFTKETLWAVSVIIVCMLTACFLLLKSTIEKSKVTTISSNENTIVFQEFNTFTQESSYTVSDSITISDPSEDLTMDSVELSNTSEDLIIDSVEISNTSEYLDILSETKNAASEAMELYTQNNEITSDSEETIAITPAPDYDCPIDFAAYLDINKDVYAWINIPGTIIDYPILQHETDDSYYLNYNIDGTEGFPGCIYTEKVNSKDFMDNNTAIYGHDMRNGTMFTDLHKFRDKDFFAEHDTVYIYTPTRQLTYKIFAAYIYDNRHLMNSFDFSNPEVYANYLDEIQNGDFEEMNLREEIEIADTDKIITLITCTRGQPEKRVYVQAVLQP